MINRDEKGRFARLKNEAENNYGYYSKVLNKPFDSLEELKAAELKHESEKKEALMKSNKRKDAAHEIEEAYKSYLDILEKTNKELADYYSSVKKKQDDAYNKFVDLKNKFIEDYGSFHMTFVDKEPKVDTDDKIDSKEQYSESMDRLFDLIQAFFPGI